MKTFPQTLGTIVGLVNLLLATSLTADPVVTSPAGPGERPCKIIETVSTAYPTRMTVLGVTQGSARMLLQIDETGRLVDALVTAYTHKPFADEALRVVKEWRYEPGLSRGEPITTIMNITFNFELTGIVVREVWGGTDSTWGAIRAADFEYTVRPAGKLDRPPVPVKAVPPLYPQEWAAQGITGSVSVEFYIDDTGKVRMPYASAGAHEKLAGVALAAVRQWEFTPPTSKGKPVLTQVRQTFEFKPQPAVPPVADKTG